MAEEEGAELGSSSSSSQATSRRWRAEGSAGVLVAVGFVAILSLLVTLDLLDLYPSLEDETSSSCSSTSSSSSSTSEKDREVKSWKARFFNMSPLYYLGLLVFCILLTLAVALPLRKPPPPPPFTYGPQVNLGYTTYVGTRLPNNVNQFLGMRYASPPTGDFRWRAPAEPEADGATHNADKFKPICFGIYDRYPSYGHDEDCLFVNVWAPATASPTSKLPVWVFIQGGGYTANSNANYNGSEVVERSGGNIVFVNFNYRVGLWGFLASQKVRDNGDLNAGLLDQRLLLEWVRDHIDQFGGDPDHVVIHGASAGAGSVALHMAAHGGRDDKLFVGAMAESVFFPAQPFVSELEWQFDRVADAAGCNSSAADPLGCLRGLDTAALQSANNDASAFPGRTSSPSPLFYWTPCVDGDLLPDLPYDLFTQGRFVDVPVLYGTDTDEGSIFAHDAATADEMAVFFANNFPRLRPNDTAAIQAQYPLMPPRPRHQAWFPSAAAAYGEATFTCPAVNILDAARDRASAGAGTGTGKQWSYRYDVHDDDNDAAGLGVVHMFDAAAVFGPDNINGAPASYYTYNAHVVPLMMDYWISFVRDLDPNTYRNEAAPEWDPWGPNRDRLLFRTANLTVETTPQDQVERCKFWLGLKDVMEQ